MKKYLFIFVLALSLVILPQVSFAVTSLIVTGIDTNRSSAIANNSWTDSWKWTFNVTVPTGEDKLQMKFLDWTNSGAGVIPAGSNMRYYSAQSLNAPDANGAITIASANTYADNLILDSTKGQQVQVAVEVKIPTGTTGGAYSTSYGIQTTGTSASNTPDLSLRLSSNSQATSTMINEGNQKVDVFGVKTKDGTVSWITDVSFKINSKEGYIPRELISGIGLNGSNHPSNVEWSSDDTVTFHKIDVRLSQNWADFTLITTPFPTTTPLTFSATLDASEIKAEDNSGVSLDVSDITDITSNETTFSPTPLGSILTSLDSYSPVEGTMFSSGSNDVSLGTFVLRSKNQWSTLESFRIKVNNDKGEDVTTLFNNIHLSTPGKDGYATTSLSSDGFANFTNLNISLHDDSWEGQGFEILADSIYRADEFSASTTLFANSIVATDTNGFRSTTTEATDITSNNIIVTPDALSVSLSANSPTASLSFASNNGEVENVPLLIFNAKAEDSDTTITDLNASIQKTGEGSAVATVAQILVNGEVVGSATINPANGSTTFSNINIPILKDTTKILTLRIGISNANSVLTIFTASVGVAGVTAESSNGDPISSSGSATGNGQSIQTAGAVINLVNTTIGPSVVNTNGSTTALSGTFNLSFVAVGGDLVKPVASDFAVKATNNPEHTDAITVTNMGFSVTPNNSLIADGSTATVTLTPTLINAQVTDSGNYFFYVESIKSTISGQSPVTKTTGLENYVTSSTYFTK